MSLTSFFYLFAVDVERLVSNLTSVFETISNNAPYQLYRSVCQALAVLHHKRGDAWLTAFYLMETQAITFSHKANLVSAQKLQ